MLRARSISASVWLAAAALLSGVLIAVIGPAFTVRMPIYAPVCSPCKYEYVIPNTIQIPIFALVLGTVVAIAYAGAVGRSVGRADVVAGLSGGLAASLVASLIRTATLAFTDTYIGLAYRAYAVAFVFTAILIAAVLLARAARRENLGKSTTVLALPCAAALIAASLIAIKGGVAAVGMASAVGALVGATTARTPLAVRVVEKLRRVRPSTVLVALVLVDVALRIVFGFQALLRVGSGMPFALLSDDGPAYWKYANDLYLDPAAAGAVLSNASGYPPAYSFFLAAIFWVTRESFAVVVALQALLAAVSAILVYAIARDLAGRGVALIAVALVAVDQNLIHSEATLAPESILVPAVLAALYLVGRYQRERRDRWIVSVAALLGLAFVTRNLIFVLTIAMLAWLLFQEHRGRWLRDAAIVLAATLIAATPVLVATATLTAAPRVTNQLAGLGYGYGSDSGITVENGFLIDRDIDPTKDPLGSARRALADPLPVVQFIAAAGPQRISALLFFPNYGSSDPLLLVNPAVYASPFGQTWLFLLLVSLVVGTVWLVRSPDRARRRTVALLAAYVIVYIALFALVFPPRQAYRYRIPIQPLLQIAEAVGIVAMARYTIAAWRSRAAPAAVPAIAR